MTDHADPRDFGWVSGQDATASIQAAIDSLPSGGGVVLLPAGQSNVSAPLTVSKSGTVIRGGGGRLRTFIQNTVSDVFNLGTLGGGSLAHLVFEDFRVNAYGGNMFVQNVGVSLSEFRRVRLKQASASHKLWHCPVDSSFIDNLVHFCDLELTAGHPVAGWHLAGQNVHRNTFTNLRCTNSGAFFFLLEQTSASTYNYDNVFRDINLEVCEGGGIRATAAWDLVVDQMAAYDGVTYTAPLVDLGANGAGLRSVNATLHHVGRRGGALSSGVADVLLRSGAVEGARVVGCTGTPGSRFTIDLGGNAARVVEGRAPDGGYLNDSRGRFSWAVG